MSQNATATIIPFPPTIRPYSEQRISRKGWKKGQLIDLNDLLSSGIDGALIYETDWGYLIRDSSGRTRWELVEVME